MGGEIDMMKNMRGITGDMGMGLGGIIGGMFGGHSPLNYNSATNSLTSGMDSARNAINDYTNRGINTLNPYNAAGSKGIAGMEHFANMFSNPEQFYQHFSQNYQMSPGAQNKLHTGMNAVRSAMAAQGLDGSGSEAKALTNYSQGVINEDMNSQYNNMMNAAHAGMSAYNSLFGGGENAAMREAGLYQGAGQSIAQMQEAEAEAQAREEEAAENARAAQKNANRSSITSGIGALVGAGLNWL